MRDFNKEQSEYRKSIQTAFKQINNDNLAGAETSLCHAATLTMIYADGDRNYHDAQKAPDWPERARRLISARNFIRDYREFIDGPKACDSGREGSI